MLLLITAFLLKRSGAHAVPLPEPIPTYTSFDAPLFARDNSSNGCHSRTVWSILWSCLATTFACTWVSVHPNVPWRNEGKWALLGRRLFLMFFSILAPEFMIMWAFKQWRGAVMIRDAVNAAFPGSDKPWSTVHGHLLQMGGFRLHATTFENCFFRYFINPEETYFATVREREVELLYGPLVFRPKDIYEIFTTIIKQLINVVGACSLEEFTEEDASRVNFGDDTWEGVLTFDALKQLLTENLICFPTITEDEINDRSKGDALSKGIALLQLTWFIVQIVTRAARGLAITELELTTAALAGLNSVIYIFWWNKPRDVRFPVVIQTKGVEELLAKTTEDVIWTFGDEEFRFRTHLWMSITSWTEETYFALRSFLVSSFKRIKTVFLSDKGKKTFPRNLKLYCSRIYQALVRTVEKAEEIGNTEQEQSNVDVSFVGSDHQSVGYEVGDEHAVSPNLSNADNAHVRPYSLAFIDYAKSTLKTAALPLFFLIYVFDLVLIIPIGKIVVKDYSGSFSDQFYGFNVEQKLDTFFMMFYSEETEFRPLLIASLIAGSLFGAVHCLAWDFSFPSHAEKIMWITAALGIVGSCFMSFAGAYTWKAFKPAMFWLFGQWASVIFIPILVSVSLIYPVARITLLVLAVTSLRSLPPSAFDTVDWIELVPHI